MTIQTDNIRIKEIKTLTTPVVIHEELPISKKAALTTHDTRATIHNILHGKDDRLLVVTGPCSIHDVKAALDYASKLKPVIDKHRDSLLIVMRVYFEKPRTTIGWKGLINDPNLDGSFEINKGVRLARQLLLDLNEMQVPTGTEHLDLITPQYISDLISWGAIGARTTESQAHRELASGLSCPVGFKNGTDGTIKIAVDAVRAAIRPHHFLSIRKDGNSAIFSTEGNIDAHIILRGGRTPNYDRNSIDEAIAQLKMAKLTPKLMIDFSHANSNKNHLLQIKVGQAVARQISAGDQRIFGIMIESHLVAGSQNIQSDVPLVYGQSITDACLGWEDTATLIDDLARAAKMRRQTLSKVE